MQYKRKDSILSMVEVPDCITAEYYDSVETWEKAYTEWISAGASGSI